MDEPMQYFVDIAFFSLKVPIMILRRNELIAAMCKWNYGVCVVVQSSVVMR